MDIIRSVVLPGPPEEVFALVDDLDRYPAWMALVHDVTPSAPDDEGRRAWDVELQAQVGPFARSKRLRMVRTHLEVPTTVVFERVELDGRRHAPWVLRSVLHPTEATAVELTMTLTYGGSLWTGAVLQRVLDDHVERGAAELARLRGDADGEGRTAV